MTGVQTCALPISSLQFEPDVKLLPQRSHQLIARCQALVHVHPFELALAVVDPADALDRLLGHLADADQFVELAPVMNCVSHDSRHSTLHDWLYMSRLLIKGFVDSPFFSLGIVIVSCL